MDTDADRSRRYRQQALELTELATKTTIHIFRDEYLRLAAEYEMLAETAERKGQPWGRRSSGEDGESDR